MRVSEIMNKVRVIEHDMTLKQAAKVMSKRGIGSLVVLKKDKIAGIVTERDVMKNIDKLNKRVSKVMNKDVVTIDGGEQIDDAAVIMSEGSIKRLPVVHKGKLVGILTATDILAHAEGIGEDLFFE